MGFSRRHIPPTLTPSQTSIQHPQPKSSAQFLAKPTPPNTRLIPQKLKNSGNTGFASLSHNLTAPHTAPFHPAADPPP